jgi:hypothetical protein
MYYGWSKEFPEAGNRRRSRHSDATSDEVKDLRRKAAGAEEVVTDFSSKTHH